MEVAQLNLPARYSAGTHFKAAYGAAHTAAERLEALSDPNGQLQLTANREQTRALVKLCREQLCAAQALDNLLAGSQPPKRGE